MTRRFLVQEPDGTRRRVDASAFPLSIGGPDADIPTQPAGAAAVAHIGLADGEVFVQPAAGKVTVNRSPITSSHWLRGGDIAVAGGLRIEIQSTEDSLRFCLGPAREPTTDPPIVVTPFTPAGAASARETPSVPVVKPVAFKPAPIGTIDHPSRRSSVRGLFFWAALILLGGGAWAVLNARAVAIEIQPVPDTLTLTGNLFAVRIGDRFLAHPGSYRVVAEKDGYRPFEAKLDITAERSQTYEFSMMRLPGRLALVTEPSDGAKVFVDAVEVGETPLEPIELAPGKHQVVVSAPGYREFRAEVEVQGAGSLVNLDAKLEPRFAAVTFQSEPPGASIRVAGAAHGRTPLATRVLEGTHDFQLNLEGYKPHRGSVHVVAGKAQTLSPVRLERSPGKLALSSVPSEASVTLDGAYQGTTPLDLHLTPGETYRVDVSRPGYTSVRRDVALESSSAERLEVELEAQLGEIELVVDPPDALLFVNGEPRGAAKQVLKLPAAPHRIEIKKDAYESFATDITPRPGFAQTIEVTLETTANLRAAAILPVIKTSKGHELVLIQPTRFEMGASRREPGRRANESIRNVEITRPYYLATMEVTNRQFREFRAAHRSGDVKGLNLEIDHHPVVRVSWQDAAAYCNWLSEQDSLPAAYVNQGGKLIPVKPYNTGYRLPTEAEWSRAARYPSGKRLKYPWGDTLPVGPGSGNYADEQAKGLVTTTLPGYDDGFAATAPSESFGANTLGLFNMGGNVAEWVQDLYTIYPSAASELVQDPTGPDEGEFNVIRGASWLQGSVTELRLTFRDYGSTPRPDVGFRIARNLE